MRSAIYAAALLLTACGGQSQGENVADRLDEAADQSTPEAANVLEDAADRVETANGHEANLIAEQALNQAANAQALPAGNAQ